MTETVKRAFAPVAAADACVLVLGSLPGEASLAAGRYYANPSNQFWRLLGGAIGIDLPALDYGARLERLKAAGITLWDVVRSATRTGSSDGAIRAHEANPLAEFVAGLPRLRAVGFNGGTAAAIGRRQLAGAAVTLVDLPSSSAAYCAIPFEAKLARWLALRPFVRSASS